MSDIPDPDAPSKYMFDPDAEGDLVVREFGYDRYAMGREIKRLRAALDGFTRFDVGLLRRHALEDRARGLHAEADADEELAAKISALLPPEPVAGKEPMP